MLRFPEKTVPFQASKRSVVVITSQVLQRQEKMGCTDKKMRYKWLSITCTRKEGQSREMNPSLSLTKVEKSKALSHM